MTVRTCHTKIYFVSRAEAVAFNRRSHGGHHKQRPYRCDTCDGWHLSSRKKKAVHE